MIILCFVLVAAVSAQYNPASQGVFVKPVAIVRQVQDFSPEGPYTYSYDTENGISVAESGALKPVGPKGEPAVVAQGFYSYVDETDGKTYKVEYVADENGFQPTGDHIPPVAASVSRKTATHF
ncbi:cuticle protein CP14.6 isoform X2 [Cephus cinctus]|uniref:Cuticle protein CP14.6 isoform X2 n=1 Tax=Cephus cinctus TaxID=211228 RepID=A0AAJ7C9S0_CEPCN|nr:cuticle protein CP14.6 isoform X2 [Cephus cinctus]